MALIQTSFDTSPAWAVVARQNRNIPNSEFLIPTFINISLCSLQVQPEHIWPMILLYNAGGLLGHPFITQDDRYLSHSTYEIESEKY